MFVFWLVGTNVLVKHEASVFRIESERSMFYWNVGSYLPDNTASLKSIRLESNIPPLS